MLCTGTSMGRTRENGKLEVQYLIYVFSNSMFLLFIPLIDCNRISVMSPPYVMYEDAQSPYKLPTFRAVTRRGPSFVLFVFRPKNGKKTLFLVLVLSIFSSESEYLKEDQSQWINGLILWVQYSLSLT